MALAQIKTKETDSSVEEFINGIQDERKRRDSFELVKLMQKVSNERPKIWGNSIIGFGNKRYKSPNTSREVDWFKIGFAPRKANLTLYLITDLNTRAAGLDKLGKHKTGGGCIYINKLEDVNLKVLEEMVTASFAGK